MLPVGFNLCAGIFNQENCDCEIFANPRLKLYQHPGTGITWDKWLGSRSTKFDVHYPHPHYWGQCVSEGGPGQAGYGTWSRVRMSRCLPASIFHTGGVTAALPSLQTDDRADVRTDITSSSRGGVWGAVRGGPPCCSVSVQPPPGLHHHGLSTCSHQPGSAASTGYS